VARGWQATAGGPEASNTSCRGCGLAAGDRGEDGRRPSRLARDNSRRCGQARWVGLPTGKLPLMRAVDVVRYHGGAARWSQLAAAGVSRSELARELAAGHLVRVGRGTYSLPGIRADYLEAVRLNGYLSHATAAAAWGLDLLGEPTVSHCDRGQPAHPQDRGRCAPDPPRPADGDDVQPVASHDRGADASRLCPHNAVSRCARAG
jgi:hypothetical protein